MAQIARSRRFETPVLFLHIAALILAIGPLLFFAAAVAPAAFRLLPTRDLAASLVSPILAKACWMAQGSFAVLFLTSLLLSRWWEPPRLARALLTRASLLGLIATLVVEKLLISQIDRIRTDAPGLIDNLPASDPGRLLLVRYHRLSTAFLTAAVVAALLILIVTTRLIVSHRQSPPPAAAQPPMPKLLDLSRM